ncbi:glycosyltransferase [Selenomonas sp. AE3005]|uniref:glycosyltransferase n=1 Tax=Selenomonas sp. AE3005 TaxID=1485543 RepID=UPI000B0B3D54|nr:glycosyltransferase [Selenomonas sp. AE3005]
METKKMTFTGVEDMTIVTPSKWLASLVKESFLNEYQVKVINNGIDLNVFKPKKSDFRERYKIKEGVKILLGVSFGWSYRKGLDVFIDLNKRLDKSKYVIVIVGVDKNIILPQDIIAIERTSSKHKLAEIYTAADVFINPTREENFPTVNIEALACGTPVVTFRTGGSAEIINKSSGLSVEPDDLEGLMKAIKDICKGECISTETCLTRSKCFDRKERFREFVELYKNIAGYKDKKI